MASVDAQWWTDAGGDVLDAVLIELKQVLSGGGGGGDTHWAGELRTRLKQSRGRLEHERNKEKAALPPSSGGTAGPDPDGHGQHPAGELSEAATAAYLRSAHRVNPPVLAEIQDVCIRRLRQGAERSLNIPAAGMAGEI